MSNPHTHVILQKTRYGYKVSAVLDGRPTLGLKIGDAVKCEKAAPKKPATKKRKAAQAKFSDPRFRTTASKKPAVKKPVAKKKK
jgi:hypothetical protein